MFELLVVFTFLFSLWVFGRILILVCKLDDYDWLAMPIGLCLVGLFSYVLYFMCGFTVQSIQFLFLCALIPCLVMLFYRGIRLAEWCRLAAVIGIFLFLALPAWIGGEQYYVFRGNHWDQFFYLNQSLVLWANPLHIYQHALANKFLSQDILASGLMYIHRDPTVMLVFAVLLPDGRGNIHLLAILYVTALWALVFPAVRFVWKRVLEAYGLKTISRWLLIGPPFAYLAGFWGQYIFDINDWKEMAGLSLLLGFVFEYIKLLQQLVDPVTNAGKYMTRQYILTGLLAVGSFLFYPENTVMHVPLLLAATVLWFLVTRQNPGLKGVVSLAVFAVAVFLISSIPNWEGAVGFVVSNAKFGLTQPNDWWKYFDGYWLGFHSNAMFDQIIGAGDSYWRYFDSDWWKLFNNYWRGVQVSPVVGGISVLANLVLALIGMYFVTPDYSMSLWLRYAWMGITIILAILAGLCLAVSLFVRLKANQTTLFLKAFFLSGVVFMLYLLNKGTIWSLGKALTYLSPYLFLVICIGFLEADKGMKTAKYWIKAFVIIFLLSQTAFGFYRLWSASDPKGIGYNGMYPSVQDWSSKTSYLWDMDPNEYAHCKGVNLYNDVDPTYLEYVKQKFFYMKMPYFSSLPVIIDTDTGPEELGYQPPIMTDCTAAFFQGAGKWIVVKM
jgi:hypothetical protein